MRANDRRRLRTSPKPGAEPQASGFSRVMRTSETGAFVVIMALGGWVLYLTTTFARVPPMLSPGLMPHTFPQLLVYTSYALAVIMLLQALRRRPQPLATIPAIVWRSAGLILGFVVLAQLDLFIAFICFIPALSLLWGERRWLMLMALALILPITILVFFNQVLEVRFPRGLLTNIYYDW